MFESNQIFGSNEVGRVISYARSPNQRTIGTSNYTIHLRLKQKEPYLLLRENRSGITFLFKSGGIIKEMGSKDAMPKNVRTNEAEITRAMDRLVMGAARAKVRAGIVAKALALYDKSFEAWKNAQINKRQ